MDSVSSPSILELLRPFLQRRKALRTEVRVRGRQRFVVAQAFGIDQVAFRHAVAAVRHELVALGADEEMDPDLRLAPRISCEFGHWFRSPGAVRPAGAAVLQ